MIKRFLVAAVLVVLVCGGLVGFNLFRSKMIADFFANQQMPAATVSAATIEPVTWTPQIEAIGTLAALQGVDVAVEVGGVVREIAFKANDNVAQGQLLLQIEDAVERADLSAAEAALARDQAQLERARALSRSGFNSEANLETVQTAVAASQSALARLQATIELKAVEAPFAGTVGIPRVEAGQYLQPGAVVATLQQLDTMRVDFTMPEQEVGKLSIGQPVSFGLTEEEFPFTGKIIGIDPKIDPATRLVAVRAELANSDGTLRPGQFVRVRVELPAMANVIAVPQTSVVTSLYGDYVYLVADAEPAAAAAAPADASGSAAAATPAPAPAKAARQAFVTVGRRQGTLVEIVKGVDAGQTVVTSGQNKLANNMPLIINNSAEAPAATAQAASQP